MSFVAGFALESLTVTFGMFGAVTALVLIVGEILCGSVTRSEGWAGHNSSMGGVSAGWG